MNSQMLDLSGLSPASAELLRKLAEEWRKEPPTPELANEESAVDSRTPEERAKSFREWADSHKHITAVVKDDSRESIY